MQNNFRFSRPSSTDCWLALRSNPCLLEFQAVLFFQQPAPPWEPPSPRSWPVSAKPHRYVISCVAGTVGMDPETASANHFPMPLMSDKALFDNKLLTSRKQSALDRRRRCAPRLPNCRSHENVSFLCGLYGVRSWSTIHKPDLLAVSRPHGSQGYSEIQSLLPFGLDAHVLGPTTMSSPPHSQTHRLVVVGMTGSQNAWHPACVVRRPTMRQGIPFLYLSCNTPPRVVCYGPPGIPWPPPPPAPEKTFVVPTEYF